MQSGGNKDNALFSFAKVWSAEKDSLEEFSEEAAQQVEQVDSWTKTLERIAAERQQAQAEEFLTSGRGVRRKTAATFNQVNWWFLILTRVIYLLSMTALSESSSRTRGHINHQGKEKEEQGQG